MQKVLSQTQAPGQTIIIGAGPAGLSAAHRLAAKGLKPLVLDADEGVGGIARTVAFQGCRFDIGGHRFFTKMTHIDSLWRQMLGPEFIKVQRSSRILYRNRFFEYPLKVSNALGNIGMVEAVRIVASFMVSQVSPYPEEENFEQWMSNRFGKRLYEIFFKTYTEKVWGRPCTEIRADWAAQRIKGLSLIADVMKALFGIHRAKTLIDEFDYPVQGPGMMWERFAQAVVTMGGEVRLRTMATRIRHENGRVYGLTARQNDGEINLAAGHIISSMPLNHLVAMLDPPPPQAVLTAARSLSYRAFVLVGLILRREAPFRDQWIYVHSPAVQVGRIQNFKNWSAAMAPEPGKSSIGMEYFCDEGDATWTMADEELIKKAAAELETLGLGQDKDVITGLVIRQPNAYPIYTRDYTGHLGVIRDYLDGLGNLQTIGRGGMHRYNNMDHAMQTGILAAENCLGASHNLWSVNVSDSYLEKDKAAADPLAPERMVLQTFSRMDKTAFGCATGSVAGLLLFLATIGLVIKGGLVVGPRLGLLVYYFPGFSVTSGGAFIGLAYGFACGYIGGWLFAAMRNFFLIVYILKVKKTAELSVLKKFVDYL